LGQPIIKYSLDSAKQSGCFETVMVSTDDLEISALAEKLGATVPFLRSKKNSDDQADTKDVIFEVLTEYKNRGIFFENVCCIYPCAPFIRSEQISKALDVLMEQQAEGVVSVVKIGFPIQRTLKLQDGLLKMFYPEFYQYRSQDLEPAYQDCGMFYWLKVESFLNQLTLYPKETRPFFISELEMQDIDNEQDWKMAEFKYKYINNLLTDE
jgi:N-acylneuraminate cytidylyltransferase